MERTNPRSTWFFLLLLVFISLIAFYYMFLKPAHSPIRSQLQVNLAENSADSYTTVTDAAGNIILETALPVNIDDEYIDENNQHYIVIKVQGREASAILKRETTATAPQTSLFEKSHNVLRSNEALPVQADRNIHIVVYHTHTDESFTPTSKTPTKPGNGDVFAVGARFTEALRSSGISVTHSLNKHDPHNINAYNRSRRTLVQLLKEQPDAAIDIHRDSAPTNAYLTTINGVLSSKVMIVIGRSNPHMQTNLQYAQTVKAQADQLFPGLIRGIYMGKGSYNQDLYPTALLFEIGTESISQDLAEKAATCMADVLSITLGK